MSKLLPIGRREFLGSGLAALSGAGILAPAERMEATPSAASPRPVSPPLPSWCPQPYTVRRDDAAGTLELATPYYSVRHDLKKGGALSRIHYTYGKAENLLLRPLAASVQQRGDEPAGEIRGRERRRRFFTDVADPSPTVSTAKNARWDVVTVTSKLLNHDGEDSGIVSASSYTYRWGYIKIHRELRFPSGGLELRRLSVVSTLLHPSLTHYGYNPHEEESFSPEVLQNGSCFWGKIRPGTQFDVPFQTRYIPRYLVWANPGVEGIEWFASDALAQWDYLVTGQTGAGSAAIHPNVEPAGVAISIDPLNVAPTFNLPRGGFLAASGTYTFDYYLGFSVLDGQARPPWWERSFNPHGGKWVSEDEIQHNAALGVGTMTLHDDGDANHDGLYWRDGAWPPYPPDQMKKMAEVIDNCHKYHLKTVPYFSNHELNYGTKEIKTHGEEWGCKPDDQGTLRPNYNWGALMCLKSGWLDFFKLSVDRALKNYPFDGVYYDWNQALYCNNPLHVGKESNGVDPARGLGSLAVSPTGHWDVDELLELMEWTRERVGPAGLILVHNSMNPMLAVENFVNAVCTMEWGYGRISSAMPLPQDLPLEWNMAGARARAVIEYGSVAREAPPQVRQRFYLTALVTGVATWPARDGALEVFKLLAPLGDLTQYRFDDWRNQVVSLGHAECYSAVYSRPGDAWLILANLGSNDAKANIVTTPTALPHPMTDFQAEWVDAKGQKTSLDAQALAGPGLEVTVPATGAALIHLSRA